MAIRLALWATLMGFAVVLSVRSWRLAVRSGNARLFDTHWLVMGFLLVSVLFSLASMVSELPRARRRRCESLATQGRCGGCGYELSDVIGEPDGCRVCPECGTAWRA